MSIIIVFASEECHEFIENIESNGNCPPTRHSEKLRFSPKKSAVNRDGNIGLHT